MIHGFFSKAGSANSHILLGFCMFSRGRQNKRGEWGRFTTWLEFIRTQSQLRLPWRLRMEPASCKASTDLTSPKAFLVATPFRQKHCFPQLQSWDFVKLKMYKAATLFSFNFSAHGTRKDWYASNSRQEGEEFMTPEVLRQSNRKKHLSLSIKVTHIKK